MRSIPWLVRLWADLVQKRVGVRAGNAAHAKASVDRPTGPYDSFADSVDLPRCRDIRHQRGGPWGAAVTSTTSPMKKSPGTSRASIVFDESARVSTPPSVTSAFA